MRRLLCGFKGILCLPERQLFDVVDVVPLVPEGAPENLSVGPEFTLDAYDSRFIRKFREFQLNDLGHLCQPVKVIGR